MNLRFLCNSKKLANIIQNQVEKNKKVYEGKLFDTQADFLEHLYQLAQIVSNKYVEINTSDPEQSWIIVWHGSRYNQLFII